MLQNVIINQKESKLSAGSAVQCVWTTAQGSDSTSTHLNTFWSIFLKCVQSVL